MNKSIALIILYKPFIYKEDFYKLLSYFMEASQEEIEDLIQELIYEEGVDLDEQLFNNVEFMLEHIEHMNEPPTNKPLSRAFKRFIILQEYLQI